MTINDKTTLPADEFKKIQNEMFNPIKNMSISIVYNDDYKNILPKFKDDYFDLALCDIPYGIDVTKMSFLKEVNTTVKQKNGTRINGNPNKKVHALNDWDKQTPPQEYFDEIKRISKHQIIFGVEYVNWEGLGKGRIKWDKGVAEGVSFKKYEMAYCSMIDYEMELPLLWAGMCQAKSLSEPMTQQGNKKLNEKRIHPCHKPIMLYDKLLLEFGFKGMKVIDTHLGGGSSRISSDKFGVGEFVGIEIDEKHFNDHEDRWTTYKRQLKLDLF
jgi:site-specific DNA-methyltransferase (adenine-specific)